MLFTSLQIKQGQHMTLQFHPNYQDNAIPFPEADLRAAILHATLTSQNVFGQTIHFYFQTDPNDPENIAPHPVAEVLSVGHDGNIYWLDIA
jgi:hypothetical protein